MRPSLFLLGVLSLLLALCAKAEGRTIGSYCTSTAFFQCPAGASCQYVPGSRYRNYCFCTQSVSVEVNSTYCKPLDGKVLGACKNGTACDDPYATCSKETGKCECGPGTTIEPETLTCRLKAGQNCAGADKKKLCEWGTICGHDKICRVMGGRDCSGARKDLCEDGYICPDGYGRCCGDFGTLMKRNGAHCRPGATKDYDDFCWIAVGGDCKDNKDLCHSRINRPSVPGVCDPPTNTCKVLINSSWCMQDEECPAGAICTNRKCQCIYTGETFAKHQDRVCGLPRGRVGAQCGTADDPNGCYGDGEECKEKTGYCVCKKGFTENINSATCVLNGPKCTFHGWGVINTFSRKSMDVLIPCRFRMAKFKCGKAKVEVFANRNKSLVEEVTVFLKVGDSKYRYEQTADRVLKGEPWKSKCLSDQCEPDRVCQLTVNTSGNSTVLERGLLRISYNRTSVHTECGHNRFIGLEAYPQALCASPSEEKDTVHEFTFRMKIAGGRIPDGFFWWVWEKAFDTAHVNERAILYSQKVPQSNPVCTELSNIVSGNCSGRVENMYNCSHLIDEPDFTERLNHLLTYKECFGSTIDPLKVYAACLRVMCGRDPNAADVSEATCNTLTQAAGLCEGKVGRNPEGDSRYLDPYMSLSYLLDRHAPQCRDQA